MFHRRNTSENSVDAVIIDEKRVSVSALKREAKKANRRFWALSVSLSMIMMMILPYMSMAAVVASSDSNVFTGTVIPGYSMGGIELAAYGVDINSWGQVDKDTVVQSNYGVWSGSRSGAAKSALGNTVLSARKDNDANNYNLSGQDKSDGWKQMTGRSAYSWDNPNGEDRTSQSNQYDYVAPYRTQADVNFWNKKEVSSGDNASATVTVDLCADFIIVGVDEDGRGCVLQSPDAATDKNGNRTELLSGTANYADGTRGGFSGSTAIPYYVPLSALFDAYGISNASGANITNLMSEMAKQDADGKRLGTIAKNNNLLEKTQYKQLNSNTSNPNGNSNSSAEAFNPYPYTMVFTTQSDTGSTVVSSMYGNDEAYVYFSPSSVYAKYMTLKAEYESIKSSSTQEIAKNDSVKTFQLGYYAASMSILEAYLEEALPQDMTRGYVGTSESESTKIYETNPGEGKLKNFNATSESDIKKVTFSSLMYDVAANNRNTFDIVQEEGDVTGTTKEHENLSPATSWLQPETNAIMDLLSVFGYNNGTGATHLGVMQGLTATQTQQRLTALTPYTTSTTGGGNVVKKTQTETRFAGVYTPVYFPIQQQTMPGSEKAYRFQILTSVPYETLTHYIKNYGFSNGVTLNYSSNQLNNLTFNDYASGQDKLASLAAQYDKMSNSDDGTQDLYLVNVIDGSGSTARQKVKHDMISIYGNETNSGSDTTNNFVETADRIDSALLGYNASNMNSDNVHDLLDVVRATCNLKYDTWFRYYNPIKSEGGDTDLFVTRISPAKTTYFPSILTRGYVSAGGVEATGAGTNGATSATTIGGQYDFFSIPSFAPCFASHTASDCYYGVLNYELRAFYSKGFLSVLSDGTGLPQLELYEKAMEEAKSSSNTEQAITWQNLATLYVMGKRLAYIKTIQTVGGGNVTFTINGLVNKIKEKNHLNDEQVDGLWADIKSNKTWGDVRIKSYVPENELDGSAPYTIEKGKIKNSEAKISNSIALENFDHGDWGLIKGMQDANPYSGISGNEVVGLVDSEGNKKAEISCSFLVSLVYDDIFNSYFKKGGKYYWVDYNEIAEQIKNKDISVKVEDGGKFNKNEWQKYTVGYHTGFSIPFIGTSASSVVDDYEKKIEEAAKEITTAVSNLAQDINLVASSLPNQMQNCLAWADYQNSSDSEGQYQTDPSEANVTVNVATQVNTNDDNKVYLSAQDAQDAGINVTRGDGDNPINLSAASSSSSSSMKSKMARGVEGATWTSTGTPAGYTMSATIARIDALAANSGTTYPYSGIANGRLMSGTDQYALLQSHVIDYSSIASGIAGDLATRQRASLVKISNPEYSSITDFISNLGNIGATLGEFGRSMIKNSADMFSSVFFVKDVNTSSQANTSDAISTNTGASKGNAATFINYTTSSGITMNRLPASAKTFNVQTGDLEDNGTFISADNGYASHASSANADSDTGSRTSLTSNFSKILLDGGSSFYLLLQTLGLTLVMVFIGYIAFRNLYAYAILNNYEMVKAQMQLKTVLPRSVIAIFMIGLPPIGNGMGFEGGNFILLDLINNLVAFIAQIFVNLSSSAIMSVFTSIPDPVGNIAVYLGYFIACAVIALCFIAGTIMIVIQQLILVFFYVLGPLVWSMYVWPYSAVDGEITGGSKEGAKSENVHGVPSFANQITSRFMNLGFFTHGRAGDIAPKAFITQYALISSLTIFWGLIFWIVAMVFTTMATAPFGNSGSASASAAALTIASTGYPTASASLASGALSFGTSTLSVLLPAIICVVLFVLMGKLMIDMIKKQTGYNSSRMAALGRSLREGITMSNKIGEMAASGVNPSDEISRMKSSRSRIEQMKGRILEDKLQNNGGINKDAVSALAKKSARNKAISSGVAALAHGSTVNSVANDVKAALDDGNMKAQLAENKERKALNDAAIKNIDALNKLSSPEKINDFVNSLSAGDRKKLENMGVIKDNGDGTFEKASAADLAKAKNDLTKENKALDNNDANAILKATKQAERAKRANAKNAKINGNNEMEHEAHEEMNNALSDAEKYGKNGLTAQAAEERMKIAEYERENKDFTASGHDLNKARGRANALKSMESHADVNGEKKALTATETSNPEDQKLEVIGTANTLAAHYKKVAADAGYNLATVAGKDDLRNQIISENMTDLLSAHEFARLSAKCGRGELTNLEQQRLATTKAYYDVLGMPAPKLSDRPMNALGEFIDGENYQIKELDAQYNDALGALTRCAANSFGMAASRVSIDPTTGKNIVNTSAGSSSFKLDDVIDTSGKTVRQYLVEQMSAGGGRDEIHAAEELVKTVAGKKDLTLKDFCAAYNALQNNDQKTMESLIVTSGGVVDSTALSKVLGNAAESIAGVNECVTTVENTKAANNHKQILNAIQTNHDIATVTTYVDDIRNSGALSVGALNKLASFEKSAACAGDVLTRIKTASIDSSFTTADKDALYNAALAASENPSESTLNTVKSSLSAIGIDNAEVDAFYKHDFNADAKNVGQLLYGKNSMLELSGSSDTAAYIAAHVDSLSKAVGVTPPNASGVRAYLNALQTGINGSDAFFRLKSVNRKLSSAASVFADPSAMASVVNGTSSADLQKMCELVAMGKSSAAPASAISALLSSKGYSSNQISDYIAFQRSIPSSSKSKFNDFCKICGEASDVEAIVRAANANTDIKNEMIHVARREAAQRGKNHRS